MGLDSNPPARAARKWSPGSRPTRSPLPIGATSSPARHGTSTCRRGSRQPMPSADARFRFAEVTGLAAAGTGGFEAGVDPEWTIGSKPNGGYLLAMLGRAAVAVSAHPHIISASAYYLHAPNPGPVLIDTQVLRQGR